MSRAWISSPVSLAAGLDKNGDHIDGLAKLGFWLPRNRHHHAAPAGWQPETRLFRIRKRRASSTGWASTMPASTSCWKTSAREISPKGGILGINIGKNATTPIEKAADDYLICLDKVYNDASYVTVNISSPNTKNLRELQKDEALDDLLSQLKGEAAGKPTSTAKYVPMALKIPDLDDVPDHRHRRCLRRHRFDAVIATNTTLSREASRAWPMPPKPAACRQAGFEIDRCPEKLSDRPGRRTADHRRRRHHGRRGRGRENQGRRQPGAVLQRLHLPWSGPGQRGGRNPRYHAAQRKTDKAITGARLFLFAASLDNTTAYASQTMSHYLFILVGAVLVNNVVLVKILGLCPSWAFPKLETAYGMGAATTFVLTMATGASYIIDHYLLIPFGLEYLRTLSFIVTIAAIVQLTEMVIAKTSPTLQQTLGIYLPLITTNCAVLGVPLLNIANGYNFVESLLFGAGSAVRFSRWC